jgi:hypothetical protein
MPGPFLSDGVFIGPVTSVDTTQQNELGIMRWDASRILQYVKFNSYVTPNDWVQLDYPTGAVGGLTNAAAANAFNYQVIDLQGNPTFCPWGVWEGPTIALGNFGWITRLGPATAKVSSTAIAGLDLRPAGVTGVLGAIGTSPTPTVFGGGFGYLVGPSGNATGCAVNVRCL